MSVIFQNPLMRAHHLLEKESLRSTRIKQMFGRFVTRQVVEKIISEKDSEKIINGERKKVTCIFADIRSFTSRCEQTSPAEIFKILNEYLNEIIDIVFQHEGTIDKFIGDSVMIIFGAPVAQREQEIKAVRCAIAIQKKVAQINKIQKQRAPIYMGIGINTGETVAGGLGNEQRMDYTVLGDAINTASRIEKHAEPGQILIGHETYRSIKNRIKCRRIKNLRLHGKKVNVKIYQVQY